MRFCMTVDQGHPGCDGDQGLQGVFGHEIGTRHKYVGLVKLVKEAGGKAIVFSAKHVAGVEPATTSIAPILRFPMPDLDDGFVT
ncbi:unnamed protein product [Prunus armeniaca]|uniref:Uncharacterized protein n=1 Tax=Prunus armeniaca TaxID=36596 RepID=A0A6J5VE84_PRUAR|nr:unnamed protein product [Prunus armeniaca]